MKWMDTFHPDGSYYVPAHLERAGPFNPNGNNGFNIEHLRNFNNAAPRVAFGMETQPGHGASDNRGEYAIRRNNFGSAVGFVDTVGGTTYGGTGVYGAQIGGVWDALLGEGRNWWFFASSDWHNRGAFGPDDRRTTQDFYPGEYQRDYVLVRNRDREAPLSPQDIVNGLRTGNSFTDSGQLIDRLVFVACADTRISDRIGNALIEAAGLVAAALNTEMSPAAAPPWARSSSCGRARKSSLRSSPAIRRVRATPRTRSRIRRSRRSVQSAARQAGARSLRRDQRQSHGLSRSAESLELCRRMAARLDLNPSMANVPDAAKNTSAAVVKTFSAVRGTRARGCRRVQTRRVPDEERAATRSTCGYGARICPRAVPWETDSNGNPLTDKWTNAAEITNGWPERLGGGPENGNLQIPCTTLGTDDFDGCPAHLGARDGVKYSSYDVAAWSDLWFYSNPIYVEVKGSTVVGGRRVKYREIRAWAHEGAARFRAAPVLFNVEFSGSFVNGDITLFKHGRGAVERRGFRPPRWLREPLLHFAVLGGVLFAADYLLVGRIDDSRTIVIGAAVDAEAGACSRNRVIASPKRTSSMRCGACGSTTRCCIARGSRFGSTRATRQSASA